MTCLEARNLSRSYGANRALDGVDLRVEEGRIVGLIGPNGAGKSTLLHALVGLTPYEGELQVLGLDPWSRRDALMRDVCFIADVAVLPRWMRVAQLLDLMEGLHPWFDRRRAEELLERTTIGLTRRVRELSKGMIVQLHLALVMAIDARLLILDEPTLGLDLLYRKQFYDALLTDYFDGQRTIVVSTHDVAEVEHILTDVVFLDRGKVVLDASMEDLEARFAEVSVRADAVAAARALRPVQERQLLGRTAMLFDGRERAELEGLGEVRTPSLADLFVALLGQSSSDQRRAA